MVVGSSPTLGAMKNDNEIQKQFYEIEIDKWKKLAVSAITEKIELKAQNDELRAEIQRLQRIAVY